MAVFMDSNISYTTDKKRLRNVIATAAHLAYSTVAINYVGIGQPKCVSELYDTLPVVQRPTAEYKAYDLVAVYPKTEKLFHAACMTFDVDIICVAVTEKQPFSSKWGVFFEISYAPAIRDSTMRRYTIANSISLVEMCKGKNVIVTSGAEKSLELKGPYDIGSLGLLFGLSEGDGKSAISTNCRAVHLHGETRKTALGIVHTEERAAIERQEDVPASEG